jgi:hypothetical protein
MSTDLPWSRNHWLSQLPCLLPKLPRLPSQLPWQLPSYCQVFPPPAQSALAAPAVLHAAQIARAAFPTTLVATKLLPGLPTSCPICPGCPSCPSCCWNGPSCLPNYTGCYQATARSSHLLPNLPWLPKLPCTLLKLPELPSQLAWLLPSYCQVFPPLAQSALEDISMSTDLPQSRNFSCPCYPNCPGCLPNHPSCCTVTARAPTSYPICPGGYKYVYRHTPVQTSIAVPAAQIAFPTSLVGAKLLPELPPPTQSALEAISMSTDLPRSRHQWLSCRRREEVERWFRTSGSTWSVGWSRRGRLSPEWHSVVKING